MKATDAPEGFIAFTANPSDLCMGCHFERGELSKCPQNSSGLWCDYESRKDKTAVVFQLIEG